ncbi:hypothetical protein KCO_12702 [Pectobacterium brasiliense ICMP 19477]|nr:hypothetical protein KCO_12702 [Pectobacterium brasiliense ICMP 19477]
MRIGDLAVLRQKEKLSLDPAPNHLLATFYVD